MVPACVSSAGWQTTTFLIPGAFFGWLSAVRKSFPFPVYLPLIYDLCLGLSIVISF